MDHLSVGSKSVPQSVLVRRLLLRQLRVTLSKGLMLSLLLVRSFLPNLLPLADVVLCRCASTGQWVRSGELCCVLSLDQLSTERTTRFLPLSSSTTLEWSEEISL